MTAGTHHFRLGLFILVGLIALVGVALALGGGLFRDTLTIETYFNGSVQGLDVGSKVKYRGVLIGEVTRLGFTAAKYQQELPPSERKPYVYVEAQLDLDQVRFARQPELIRDFVDKGMRVRMAAQGITGIYFLELDYFDPDVPVLAVPWKPEHVHIPSGPSTVTQVLERADQFLAQFQGMNLPQVAKDLDTLLVSLNEKLEQFDTEAIGRDTRAMVQDLRETATEIRKIVGGPEAQAAVRDAAASTARLRKLLDDPALDALPQDAAASMAKLRTLLESGELERSIAHLESVLQSLDGALAGRDGDVQRIIDNLRRSSENLRDFSESAKRYPGALFAQPPQRVNPTETEQ